MKKTIKKTLAIILAILMITATAPMVFATDAVAELDVTGTVYIPSSSTTVTVTFTPDETGEYVIISDNGGNDAEIDPYVYILDADGNQIASDDDNDYEATYNFYCEFEAEAGETYYIKLGCANDDSEYDYVVRKNIKITHQPTMDEPYVELNTDEEVTYQWYKLNYIENEITDENAEAYSYNDETATYNAENGWTPILDSYDDYSSATMELNAGEMVIVELADNGFEYCGIWNFETGYGSGCDEENGILTYEFSAYTDGTYTVYTEAPVSHKIYIPEYVLLEGETEATLRNPECGTQYFCQAALDDIVLKSTILDYKYLITHQPTMDEPYVELNTDEEVTYQWYKLNYKSVEITDENAEAYSYNGETATYNAENGWTPILDSYNDYSSATMELKEGDKVIVEFAEGGFEYCGIWDFETEYGSGCSEEDGVLTYEFSANTDGTYTFYTEAPVSHEIYVYKYDYVLLEDEADATLENREFGTKYICQVTLENGEVLKSDILDYKYLITHQPTANEPYVVLNDDTDATYQWCTVQSEEITDENADAVPANDLTSSYDAENGWAGVFGGQVEGMYDHLGFFEVQLNSGDVLKVELSGDFYYILELWNLNNNEVISIPFTEDTNVYEIAVEEDDIYMLATYKDYEGEDVFVKAYVNNYTAIDGATEAVYAATEEGNYACNVTFKDGTTEISDDYEGPHTHDYDSTVTEPTCVSNGYTTYTCSSCGDTYTDDITDALGHDYDTVVTAPTCVSNGYTTYTCSGCGETYTDDITDALAHDYDTVVTAPTCVSNGYTTYTCTVCDDTCTADETAATGHNDADSDGYCDSCDELICDHNCHKSGITGFFWKITRFFNKLFGTNKYCECGAAHY